MNTINVEENDMNETGTTSKSFFSGRCPVEQQRRPGRQVTAETSRRKWTKDINVVIMECFYLSKPFNEDGKPQKEDTDNKCTEYDKREDYFLQLNKRFVIKPER